MVTPNDEPTTEPHEPETQEPEATDDPLNAPESTAYEPEDQPTESEEAPESPTTHEDEVLEPAPPEPPSATEPGSQDDAPVATEPSPIEPCNDAITQTFGDLPQPPINENSDLPSINDHLPEPKPQLPFQHPTEDLEANDTQTHKWTAPQTEPFTVPEPSRPTDTTRPSFREWFENPTDEIPISPDSKAGLDEMLDRHPYLRDRPSFDEHYRHLQWYITLKDAQLNDDLPKTSNHNLAQTIGLGSNVTNYWLNNERSPILLESLIAHERARCYHEAKLPREHHHYRINPTTIYEAIRPLKDQPHTSENLATAITSLYHKVEPTRFLIADLKTYHEAGPRWTRTIAKSIEKHRETVETLLNQHIPLNDHPHTRIRIGIHDHKLYLYHQRTDPNDWLTLLKHEYFYFDTTDTKRYLMDHARHHLNITDPGLSSIIQQVTNHPGNPKHPKSTLGDITRLHPYLIGESLNFLLDASGRDFEDIHLFITRLGRDTQGDGRGGIHNPIFLKGEQRDLFFTRITAIAFSDGHIHHENKQFTYIENEPQRHQYVNTLMKQFGNVYITHDERTGADRLNMPVTIGRLLEQLGVPAGDKHLSPNYRLPEFIREGSDKIKCAYLSEVIPEDGYFYTHPQIKFGIKRAQILNAGSKAERYDFKPKLSRECEQFIHDHGELRSYSIRSEPIREVKILVWGKLENLTKSEDAYIRETAIQLKKTVEANPCKLLMDEKQLCESLGINIDKKIKEIHLHQSERVSVIWEIQTLETDDTLRWAELAMPSSNPKQAKVKKWLSDREFGEKLRQKHSIDSE